MPQEYSLDPDARCYGKKVYASGAAAERARKEMAKRGKKALHHKLDVYRCQFCGGIHLGKTKASPPRKIPALVLKFKPERR